MLQDIKLVQECTEGSREEKVCTPALSLVCWARRITGIFKLDYLCEYNVAFK